MFGFLKKLLGAMPAGTPAGMLGLDELSRRLGADEKSLRGVGITYRTFDIRKRTGGTRRITAPTDELKKVQRLILRRLLGKLRTHPSATGFEPGHSIVSNALPHVAQEAVIKLDIRDFFGSTTSKRVDAYFRTIGWNADAAALLTKLTTHNGALPQGAATSPRLSNLLNYRLDARLAALAQKRGLAYSRYADDMTFSGPAQTGAAPRMNPKTLERLPPKPGRVNDIIHAVKEIVRDEGYTLHTQKKLRIARRHDRQVVTGLVVNEKANLPRSRRRWLRAVEHHVKTGKPVSLTPRQLAGWRALQSMVKSQTTPT